MSQDSIGVKKGSQYLIGLVAAVSVVWLSWSGHFEPLLLGFGVFSIALTVWLSQRLQSIDSEGQPLQMNLVAYFIWLIKEIIVANIDVIKRIISPELPISPTWVKVKSTQKTRLGRVLFANSITLTPGTVSVQIDDDTILVHGLSNEGASSLRGQNGGEMGEKVSSLGL